MTGTWSLVDFVVPVELGEIVSDVLWSMGVAAVEELDHDDGRISLRTSMGDDPTDNIERIRALFPGVTAAVIEVPRSTADRWREHAQPVFVEPGIALVPAWLDPPAGVASILVEPRDTFGLGNHPTTLLALRLSLGLAAEGDLLLDLGCGSGVLAIALAKLRGVSCDVFDIADSARATVAENCALNGVEGVRWRDDFAERTYDMVVANILAPVLRQEAPRISAITREGGHVVLSGMRQEQVESVLSSFSSWTPVAQESSDGWTSVAMVKDHP